MIELNNKPVRGKRILVTPANESQYQEHQAANQSKPNHYHSHQNHSNHHSQRGGRLAGPDPMRPTTLSILKSQQLPKGVNNKIAALEAKLASMQHSSSSSTTSSINQPSSAPGLTPTTKPSFLPENPTVFRSTGVTGGGSHTDQPLRGQTSSFNHSKSTCSSSSISANNKNGTSSSLARGAKPSKNVAPSSTTMKNPTNLDAIGLTLKEQLKRNRESKIMTENLKKFKMINTARKTESSQLDANISNMNNTSLSINPSPDQPANRSNNLTLKTQTHQIKDAEREENPDCFKRPKIHP